MNMDNYPESRGKVISVDVHMCYRKNHILEVDSVSKMFLYGCSFTFRITSITDRFSDTFYSA